MGVTGGMGAPGALCCISGCVFGRSLVLAISNTAIAVLLHVLFPNGSLSLFGEDSGIVTESAVWSTFTFLLGIVLVFRTSQCYARWWEGSTSVFNMRAEWFDAVSTSNIFVSSGCKDPAKARHFREVLVRLMSLLHATALAELERGKETSEDAYEHLAYTYDLITADDFEKEGLEIFRDSECKVELVYGWVLGWIMENVEKGVLTTPPPLLTRAFQELANGLVQFHSALRLVEVPFPFAYAHTCNGLLALHWLIAPVVTSQWTTHPLWSGLFTFIQVFVLCLLNDVADGLANPFGTDANDIDGTVMQRQMNTWLAMTLVPGVDRAPAFLRAGSAQASVNHRRSLNHIYRNKSFFASLADTDSNHSLGERSNVSWAGNGHFASGLLRVLGATTGSGTLVDAGKAPAVEVSYRTSDETDIGAIGSQDYRAEVEEWNDETTPENTQKSPRPAWRVAATAEGARAIDKVISFADDAAPGFQVGQPGRGQAVTALNEAGGFVPAESCSPRGVHFEYAAATRAEYSSWAGKEYV